MKFLSHLVMMICLLAGMESNAQWKNFTIYYGDTLNRVDVNNRKHGRWIILGKTSREAHGFAPDAIVEEGEYSNNRKIGVWKTYWPNGNIR